MSTSSDKLAAGSGSGRLASLTAWIDDRFPLTALWKSQVSEYYAPKNMNFWYYFGSLALVVLVIQILSGLFLTMNYKPSSADAFGSVEYIMRDVDYGWILRYMHSTGASAFIIRNTINPTSPSEPRSVSVDRLQMPSPPSCLYPRDFLN